MTPTAAAIVVREHLFIGSQWVAPSSDATFEVICPSTEQVVGRVPAGNAADMDAAVAVARKSFDSGQWSGQSPLDRAKVLTRLADAISEREEEFAQAITLEMGAPIGSALADQVRQPIGTIRYYAGLAETFPFEEQRSVGRTTTVIHESVGVVAAIVPWNAPLRSIINKLAPALVAGCSVIVKPAPNTPLSSFLLADVLAELDFPAGVVSIIPADREVGQHLVSHPDVDKIAFTGSTAAGKAIMAVAATNLTRVALELGGKSAAIVLDDAVADAATTAETLKRLVPLAIGNTGQACTAQSRILVSRDRHDDLVAAMCDAFQKWAPGDPFEVKTRTGPLVSKAQLDRVLGYIDIGLDEGASVEIGGGQPDSIDRGYFVEPTILTGVTNDMRVAQEEIFGPVVSIIVYDGVDEAIRIANDSDYGLSGSVWTTDVPQGVEVARQIRTGQVRVNGAGLATDAPFGGFKNSGIGREYGPEGLAAFTEAKAIAFRPQPKSS